MSSAPGTEEAELTGRAKVRADRAAVFLETLREGKTVTQACNAAGLHRRTPYKWRETSPAFRQAWDDAVATGTDVIEAEAIRRAVDGVKRPVFYKGEVVGEVVEYSDRLIELMLKARKPEYREHQRVEIDLIGLGARMAERLAALRKAPQLDREGAADVAPVVAS